MLLKESSAVTEMQSDSIRSIFPLINHSKGRRVVFHTLGVSGTIKSAKRKFIKQKLKD